MRFAPGEWINIIGYFEKQESPDTSNWLVKAILAWPVSSKFDLAKYEQVVKQRMSSTL